MGRRRGVVRMAAKTIHDSDDVEIDEWPYPSVCPVCGPGSDVRVAGAVRPVVYRCFDCETTWTRSTFKKVGDGD